MKVNIEIDCTPLEARQFFGLPDLGPMQAAVMDRLQQQMTSNIDKLTPEAIMQSWFTFDPRLAERFQDLMLTMTGLGGSRSNDKKSASIEPSARLGVSGISTERSGRRVEKRGHYIGAITSAHGPAPCVRWRPAASRR